METIKGQARLLVGPLVSAFVGVMAWNGVLLALCALPLFVLSWRWAPSRRWAFFAAAAYYLAAGRGLLQGAGVFFGDSTTLPSWAYGFAIWTIPSVVLGGVWAALWGENWRSVRLIVVLVLVSVPPVGVVGWANPITAAGALFPGTGWWGLAACAGALAYLTHSRRPAVVCAGLALVATLFNAVYQEPQESRWMAVNTNLGASHGSDDDFDRLHSLLDIVEQSASDNPSVKVFVLPELVGGDWSMNALWWKTTSSKLREHGQTVLVGALQPLDRNTHYVNALFSIGADAGKQMVDRVPVPYSMWKPWATGGADAFWTDPGVHLVGGTRIATVICYEQLLVWPVLYSFAHDPKILVGAANDWWARGTSISRIQYQTTKAWGRLFSVPVVWARND